MMKKAIAAIVKKDFKFNGKLVLGIVIGLPILFGIDKIESMYTGVSDMNDSLLLWLSMFYGVMPINATFRKEQGKSTRQFLSSLPVAAKDVFLGHMITTVIFCFTLGAVTIAEWLIFDMAFNIWSILVGSMASVFIGVVYILLNYMFNFQIAQMFLLGMMLVLYFPAVYLKKRMLRISLLYNPVLIAVVMAAFVAAGALVMFILIKKKRSL